MYDPAFAEIRRKVQISIGILFKADKFLLTNRVHERSISHKLAEYLQSQFPDWDVDCEYNRKGFDEIKKMPRECSTADTIYPDIIIHQRSTIKNLLVIEIKSNRNNSECDIEKIKLFTTNPDFNYSFGLFIQFQGDKKPVLHWYEDGNEILKE